MKLENYPNPNGFTTCHLFLFNSPQTLVLQCPVCLQCEEQGHAKGCRNQPKETRR